MGAAAAGGTPVAAALWPEEAARGMAAMAAVETAAVAGAAVAGAAATAEGMVDSEMATAMAALPSV
jgi:hypothetical protein